MYRKTLKKNEPFYIIKDKSFESEKLLNLEILKEVEEILKKQEDELRKYFLYVDNINTEKKSQKWKRRRKSIWKNTENLWKKMKYNQKNRKKKL